MRPLKPREERRPVSVSARLRGDTGWSDVTIGNVSSRGMMLRCVAPPPERAYVEVRHQGVCIVGRIVWTRGAHFGVRTQDQVDVARLLAPGARPGKQPANDRRMVERPADRPRRPPPAERAEASRRFARQFDFTAVAAAAAGLAALAAMLVFDALSATMDRSAEALAATNGGARQAE